MYDASDACRRFEIEAAAREEDGCQAMCHSATAAVTEINFVRRYDMGDLASFDLQTFLDTKIDINAVKAGFKVIVREDPADGVRVSVEESCDPSFRAFISPSSPLCSTVKISDLNLATHPANSIQRVLVKADAMQLAWELPSRREISDEQLQKLLDRMHVTGAQLAALQKLPYKMRDALTEAGSKPAVMTQGMRDVEE